MLISVTYGIETNVYDLEMIFFHFTAKDSIN